MYRRLLLSIDMKCCFYTQPSAYCLYAIRSLIHLIGMNARRARHGYLMRFLCDAVCWRAAAHFIVYRKEIKWGFFFSHTHTNVV
jgi:predicted LPLAT superfamily acyltransferase